ncbi:hypothetical protein H9C73_02980 [Marinobacterium sp. AK62]|uniref:Uncharacterized protein n=1 Tax=Marinobacterium alkalitolerans TaxID=1542925 RepID=A0ABS3Z7M0_9GAMM|nr:hypothetical protein [Marinobacterium alkalitolerans]MBP0047688.1 hypothetical protein [Marinobacterium alkalitolerans]
MLKQRRKALQAYAPEPQQLERQQNHSVIAECLAFIAGHKPNGISFQVEETGVSASMGTERFTLHPNRFELQSDIEALCRMADRRVR